VSKKGFLIGEKMEGTPEITEEASGLDRKEIARRLRAHEIDVDFEDWDGLSDLRVVEIAWNKVFLRGGIDFGDIISEHELEPYMEYPHEV